MAVSQHLCVPAIKVWIKFEVWGRFAAPQNLVDDNQIFCDSLSFMLCKLKPICFKHYQKFGEGVKSRTWIPTSYVTVVRNDHRGGS